MNKNTLIAWLRIFRIPNIFTVPGEAVAGYLLCRGDISKNEFIYLIIASISFYVFGLVTNDIADIREDSKSSPGRPLPSGDISISSASYASLILILLALGFAFLVGSGTFTVGLVILAAILGYNFLSTRGSLFPGPLLLSFCRLLNIMLGVTAAGNELFRPVMLMTLLVCETLFILGVSIAASVENKPDKAYTMSGAIIIYFSHLVFIAGAMLSVEKMIREYTKELPPAVILGILIWGISVVISLKTTFRWFTNSNRVRLSSNIGALIRNLILIQAAACAFGGFIHPAIWICLLIVPCYILSRFFYQS